MKDEKKLEEALNYAKSSNKIEDLKLEKEELEEIKQAIVNCDKKEDFVSNVISSIKRDEDGKTK